ncbi:hypothetical protein STXM2123_1821 [Streptomyces sp. F-3]|nr:hypothetical protein STXM2123_1821 [Streptomyces sp. F-3]
MPARAAALRVPARAVALRAPRRDRVAAGHESVPARTTAARSAMRDRGPDKAAGDQSSDLARTPGGVIHTTPG